MTKEIIEMAQECRLIGMRPHLDGIYSEALVAFAKLVADKALAEHAMREVQRLGQEIEQKIGCVNHDCDQCKAQPEQEPVAWVCEGSASDEKHDIDYWQEDIDAIPIGTQLYTTPPQRTWVGLTDEEKIHIEIMGGKSDVMLAEMVEAKLKEKNTI